jgi:hypothetical protein
MNCPSCHDTGKRLTRTCHGGLERKDYCSCAAGDRARAVEAKRTEDGHTPGARRAARALEKTLLLLALLFAAATAHATVTITLDPASTTNHYFGTWSSPDSASTGSVSSLGWTFTVDITSGLAWIHIQPAGHPHDLHCHFTTAGADGTTTSHSYSLDLVTDTVIVSHFNSGAGTWSGTFDAVKQ